MLIRAAVLLVLFASAAMAQPSYLPTASLDAATARSKQMCSAAKADDGVHPLCDLVEMPLAAAAAVGETVLHFAAVPLEPVDPHVFVGDPVFGAGIPDNARVAAMTATSVTLGDGRGGLIGVSPGATAAIPAGAVITFGRSRYARGTVATTDGKGAVEFLPADVPARMGLSAVERAAVKSRKQMLAVMPDAMPTAAFQARLSASERAALDTATGKCAAAWAAVKATTFVDFRAEGRALANDCSDQGVQLNDERLFAPATKAP